MSRYTFSLNEEEMRDLAEMGAMVLSALGRAMPDLLTGVECWITAGGAHHTVLSYDVTAEQMRDWAAIMGIEYVHIDKDTTQEKLEQQLMLQDIAWKLR